MSTMFVDRDPNTPITAAWLNSIEDLRSTIYPNFAAAGGASLVGFLQTGTGAALRTVQSKLSDIVSVLDYGFVPNAANNTTAVQAAITEVAARGGGIVEIPSGICRTGQIIIPSNVRIRGLRYGTTLMPIAGFATNALWLVQSGAAHVEISDLRVEVDPTTFPSTVPLYVDTAQDVYIHDVYEAKSGQIGVFVFNSQDVLIERVQSYLAKNRNIQIDGASSARCRVNFCYVDAAGGIDHGVTFSGGVWHELLNSYVANALVFNCSLFGVSRCIAAKNTFYNSVREAANIQDGSNNTLEGNICSWDTTTSQDFGLSIWGQAVGGAQYNSVRGNTVINAGKSGIAIAATTATYYNRVEANHVVNANRLNLGIVNGGGGGVILYGTEAKFNDVCNNTIFDNIGFLRYGIFEWASGGAPSQNRYSNNSITNASLGNVLKAASSVESLCQSAPLAWTPTVTAGAGTITTLGTVSARYWEDAKMVAFYISVAITTNGTGSSDIRISMPFTLGTVNALGYGRESGVSGAALTGTIAASSSTMIVRKYDNSYPGANGAVLELSGFFWKV